MAMVCNRRWLARTAFCLLALVPLAAADWRSGLPGARPVGSGEFTWFGLSLYRARTWSTVTPLAWNQPFALELTYHRNLSRDTLVEASLDEMRRLQGDRLSAATLERWAGVMREAFVDVQPGMRITGVYLPGAGCRFYVDGQLRREVGDVDFARAFFAIWLDPRARDAKLRQRLSGLAMDNRGD